MDLILKYEITPWSSWGKLDQFKINGQVDLSKIGKGIFDIVSWKYYRNENSLMLYVGIEHYPKYSGEDGAGREIAYIEFEFLDLKNWKTPTLSPNPSNPTDPTKNVLNDNNTIKDTP